MLLRHGESRSLVAESFCLRSAEADANFVLTGNGDIVEIQATGEKRGFTRGEFEALFGLAEKGIGELFALQRAAVPAA